MQTFLDAFFASIDAVAFTQSVEEELAVALRAQNADPDVPQVPTAKPKRTGESMYVRMFTEMLDTVLEGERFLFSDDECKLIERFRALSYGARYLLIRLVLRKAEKWHRSDVLQRAYDADIPDLNAALNDLCHAFNSTPQEDHEYIVVYDSDDEEEKPEPDCQAEKDFFAQDDAHASIAELVECLLVPELKLLAKSMKVKIVETKRASIVQAVITHAEGQGTLDFFRRPVNQLDRLRTMVKKTTGRCIRLNSDIRGLLQRINLVFFRSTELTATLLPLILSNTRTTNASHRHYPSYTPTRTTSIFPTRDALLTYERALTLERQIEDALANESRFEGAQEALILFKPAHRRWSELLDELEHPDDDSDLATARPGALERFHEGHVLTRVVYKGAFACGITKRYYEEEQILRSLLSQDRWRKGRRGAWYDRLALICNNYKGKTEAAFEEAMQVLRDGLNDPHTHLIHRPALEKRLQRLEKKLKVPDDERYQSTLRLKRPPTILITGRRIIPLPLSECPSGSSANSLEALMPPPPPKTDNRGRSASAASTTNGKQRAAPARPPTRGKENKGASWKSTGKSVWKGRDGDELSVEELALEHYETLGYKGFHAEGRIILHLYTLLFWSVLFDSTIEGSFETRFQSSPLDLVHDTFYPSREAAINRRLEEIEAGQALDLIREADERERPHKTWAVGVRWDDFSLDDVLEIAEGLGGAALTTICRLLSEEYSCRGSGVPDLIVWNAETTKSMFVEVKGPGDQLRENQRVWIDIMMRHGIAAEVCRVENWDYKPKQKQGSASRKSASAARAVEEDSDAEEEEANFDDMDMDVKKEVKEEAELATQPTAGPSTQRKKRCHQQIKEEE